MPEYMTQKEAFLKCKRDGKFVIVEEIDIEKIRATLEIAEGDVESAEILKNGLPKESKRWNSVLKLYYDALHETAEAFLRFERVKIDNHQCLFAHLCERYPELELSWEFLEKARTKRNGINYYGTPITQDDWKELEMNFLLHLRKLKEEAMKRLNKT